MSPVAIVIGAITHLCLVSHKRDIGKQRRPRSNTAEPGVRSLSTLFAWIHKFITKTCPFKYTENFTTKNWKFSDKNSDIFLGLHCLHEFTNSLRKHAHSNILKISPPKTESFQIKILIFFLVYTVCMNSQIHYENTPIQIYWKFHHQKLKVFRQKFWYFSYFCSKHRLWILVRTALPRKF